MSRPHVASVFIQTLLIGLASVYSLGLQAATPEEQWELKQPGFVIERVAGGFRLPVNIAFVPNAGATPDSPYFYVTELYGTVKVVSRDGTVSVFAKNLLNYTPSSTLVGAGEVGLAGIVVDPATGDVIVSLAYESAGSLRPRIVRLRSTDGGRTSSSKQNLLSMPSLTLTSSHMASNLTIGPDGKLYVHVGDAGVSANATNPDSFAGKVLRCNLDGSPAPGNPAYNATDGITARDYVWASGLRNPFGGTWRAADGRHYVVDNGPQVDRLAVVDANANLGYDGTNQSVLTGSLATWTPAHAPVNITAVQASTFSGSGFPPAKQDRLFVSEFGSYWTSGPVVLSTNLSARSLEIG